MNQQCPKCKLFQSESGEDFLASDAKASIVGGIFTLGIALLFYIPRMAVRATNGTYNPRYHYCYNCGYKWIMQVSQNQNPPPNGKIHRHFRPRP